MEPIFEVMPPPGACKVRLKTKFDKRPGGTPVISCETLTQEAVDAAIDESESLRRYIKEHQALGKRPWTIKADLQFLGSDGQPIDGPTSVEFLYYGGKAKSKGKASERLLVRLIRAQERMYIEREITHRAEVAEREQTHRRQLEAVSAAADNAAKVLSAGAEPLKAAIGSIDQTRKDETERANAANKKLVAHIEGGAQVKPDSWADDFVKFAEGAVKVAPLFAMGAAALKKAAANN